MKKKWGKERTRTKAIVWDISGFMFPCVKPDKLGFFLVSIEENNIFHP